ncbi:MAG: helix-turn-helix transcriptional regulator [Deltaproteobacteria bacterium]|nr:helix-turn-helix transcriptional regulator [Deltaproteobacteria bacterium]
MGKQKKRDQERVGMKIQKIRRAKKVTYAGLANETGLAVDYIKQIEAGDALPSVGTLLQIAKALRIDSASLFAEQEETLERRAESFSIRTENYNYKTLTPGSEDKRMKAFRVTIEPMKTHDGVSYQHEGEEFVYVLSGKIELTVGDHINTLGTGGSLQFNSGVRHKIKNVTDLPAELLVVIAEP